MGFGWGFGRCFLWICGGLPWLCWVEVFCEGFFWKGEDNLEKVEDFFGKRGREGLNARLTLAGFWVLLMGVRGSKVRLDEVAGVAVLRIPEVVTEGGSEG